MSGLDKDRYRNKTISFRMSPDERRQLEARIKACGLAKGDFFIKSLLQNQINIVAGKFQSDRLSLEIRRLKEQLSNLDVGDDERKIELLEECQELLIQLNNLMASSTDARLKKSDFATVKNGGESNAKENV